MVEVSYFFYFFLAKVSFILGQTYLNIGGLALSQNGTIYVTDSSRISVIPQTNNQQYTSVLTGMAQGN